MLVSVLINNYNYSWYLDYCIQSVLNQTYNNVEIILYDDGSTDNSLEIARKYKGHIKIISKPNYGKQPSKNQANAIYQSFEVSNGEIIFLLDSDDAFHPTKIEKTVNGFKKSKEDLVMIQNVSDEINEEGKKTGKQSPLLKQVDILSHIYQTNHLSHLFCPTSCLSFERAFLEKILPLTEDEYHMVWPDTRLGIESVFNGEVLTLRQSLTQYRVHRSNDSIIRRDPGQNEVYLNQLYRYFNDIAESYNKPPILKSTQQQMAIENIFSRLINRELLYHFINMHKEDKLVIWGAGEAGQSVYYHLKKAGISLTKFVDKEPWKQGTFIDDVPVYLPDKVQWNRNHHKIIIAAYYAQEPIETELLSKGFTKEDIIYPFLSE